MQTSAIRRAALAGLSLVYIPSLALAETAWEDEPLVVTANRTEQPADAIPARVSVIDREDIERSQAPDLLELLRLEAGIDITRTGGPGGQTSVFMRGANSNHVLVLIDGVRVAASSTGAFAWEILDPAVIERIEIVRPPLLRRVRRIGRCRIPGRRCGCPAPVAEFRRWPLGSAAHGGDIRWQILREMGR